MNFRRRKDLPYRGDWRLLVQKQPVNNRYGYSNETPSPTLHPNNVLSLRNVYSGWTRNVSSEDKKSHYEVSSSITMLEKLWTEIKPPIDSGVWDDWLEILAKNSTSESTRWRRERENLDSLEYIVKEITTYFPDFKREDNQALLLRIMVVAGV
jgi:hypothetical protein